MKTNITLFWENENILVKCEFGIAMKMKGIIK